mmetsp:Transcript_72926/g.230419  ORF Transcript_72926/g.230419 Transcript_72926/m.230419 type:complete len:227 (+) Transcript_72926:1052-1732(+)
MLNPNVPHAVPTEVELRQRRGGAKAGGEVLAAKLRDHVPGEAHAPQRQAALQGLPQLLGAALPRSIPAQVEVQQGAPGAQRADEPRGGGLVSLVIRQVERCESVVLLQCFCERIETLLRDAVVLQRQGVEAPVHLQHGRDPRGEVVSDVVGREVKLLDAFVALEGRGESFDVTSHEVARQVQLGRKDRAGLDALNGAHEVDLLYPHSRKRCLIKMIRSKHGLHSAP